MRPLTIALVSFGLAGAATLIGVTLGPLLGGWAAALALTVALGGAAVLAVACWRSCHLSPATPEVA